MGLEKPFIRVDLFNPTNKAEAFSAAIRHIGFDPVDHAKSICRHCKGRGGMFLGVIRPKRRLVFKYI